MKNGRTKKEKNESWPGLMNCSAVYMMKWLFINTLVENIDDCIVD